MRVTCHTAEMLSQAGCTECQVYWITHGCTGTPARKAPVLKGSKQCPFVVVPCSQQSHLKLGYDLAGFRTSSCQLLARS